MKRSQWREWLVLASVLGILYAIVAPILKGVKEASRPACLSHAKKQGVTLLMYCQDYDEKFPVASKWIDAVAYPQGEAREDFQCTKVTKKEYGYAFYSLLSEKQQDTLANIEKTVMTFESQNLARNAYSRGTGFATRHRDFGNVVFADGHGKALTQDGFDVPLAPSWQENEAAGTKGVAKEPKL